MKTLGNIPCKPNFISFAAFEYQRQMSLSTVFQSYQADEMVLIKSCMQ